MVPEGRRVNARKERRKEGIEKKREETIREEEQENKARGGGGGEEKVLTRGGDPSTRCRRSRGRPWRRRDGGVNVEVLRRNRWQLTRLRLNDGAYPLASFLIRLLCVFCLEDGFDRRENEKMRREEKRREEKRRKKERGCCSLFVVCSLL